MPINNEKQSAKFSVIIAAAGQSRRFSKPNSDDPSVKKPFVSIFGKPMWLHCAEKFFVRDDVSQIILVISPDDTAWFFSYYGEDINRLLLFTVAGGKERADSIHNALAIVRDDIEYIVIHDAARPCVTKQQIDAVFQQAKIDGAAILAAPIVGTVKRVQDGRIVETVDRTNLWEAQTPQVFRRDILFTAYDKRGDSNPTDDAQLAENAGYSVSIISSERSNIKITDQTDLTFAEAIILQQNEKNDKDL